MSTTGKTNTVSEVAAWHAMSPAEVVTRLVANSEKGLDLAEASVRLQKYGPNRLPEGRKRGPFTRFLVQFKNILVYVLLAAGFTKLMLNLWIDAGIIFGVVVLNALLGFIQEGKAEKALDSIRNMLSVEARTMRGGETRMIPAEQLVPGDVVLLESGDKIPADLRLIEAKNLRTEEAALTGESVPHGKDRRCGARKRSGRRSRKHGVFRDHGRIRTRNRRGRCNWERDRTRTHQPVARRGQRARNAAPAPNQRDRLHHHSGHRSRQRPDLRLRQMGEGYGLCEPFPGGRGHRGVSYSRRAPHADHDHAGHWSAAHGPAQRHHSAAACGRDARLSIANLLRQDRHADVDGNDGGVGGHGRVSLPGHRRWLCADRGDQKGRNGRRQRTGAHAHGAGLPAVQRRRAVPAGRRVEGRRRSD